VPWIIDKDHIDNGKAVGTMGPRGYTGDGTELHCQFRMYDDDGILYYEGRNNTSDDDNAFGPSMTLALLTPVAPRSDTLSKEGGKPYEHPYH